MPRVVIVGPGPVGLFAALGLARRGLEVVVLDRGDGPVDAPRAAAYHFPVVEVMAELGILDDALAADIRVTVKLGFGNLTRHGLRHTGATWMADAGIALHVPQEILGHQSIETTKGYLHPDHRHLAEAARQANQFLSTAPARRDATRRDGPRL